MTDIDTIREALERSLLIIRNVQCFPVTVEEIQAALSALERVSALNSEMEALILRCREFVVADTGSCFHDVRDRARNLVDEIDSKLPEESR